MGKKKGNDAPEVVEAPKPPPPIIENWVRIEFKLLNWKYMNFNMKFKEETYIFTIKKILRERHGKIEDLRLCFNSFIEANEIHDEMLTLKDCGLKGHPCGAAVTEEEKQLEESCITNYQLFYDYKPISQSDPVVLFFRK